MNEQTSEIQIFGSPEFGKIRSLKIDGEPWLVGKDVAEALGYQNPRDALATHIDDEDKNTVAIHDGIRGNPNMTIINESGLYSLIFSSKLPSARKFKRWVTSEVLPTIRRTGRYAAVTDMQADAHPLVHGRELTADDYITAARLAADCLDERLPYVLGFLERGGFDIPKVEAFFPKTNPKPRPPIVIDLDSFVRELIEGRELTSRG